MKKIRIFFVMSVAIAALFCCSGCVSTYTGTITKFPERTKFEPIPYANLKLEVVGSRQMVSGVDDSITLRLTNKGKYIRIEEWYMKEADNFIVYYQPWKPGTENPDPLAWETIYPVTLERPKRYPLDMSPGVAVLVRFGLPFLDGLKVTPGKERRFFLKATLSLTTVKAETDVFAISVL